MDVVKHWWEHSVSVYCTTNNWSDSTKQSAASHTALTAWWEQTLSDCQLSTVNYQLKGL